MATYEVQGADGKVYEVQADTPEQAASAIASVTAPTQGGAVNPQALGELKTGLHSAMAGAANAASLYSADEGLGLAGGLASLAQGNGYMPGYEAARDDVPAVR